MRKIIFFFSFACFFSLQTSAQNTQGIYQLLQEYFLSLPYDKGFTDWLTEIKDKQNVRIDTLRRADSSSVFLRGYIYDWPLFRKIDSTKFTIGRSLGHTSFGVNGNISTSSLDTSFFFQEAFYFPIEGIDKKAWKDIYTPLLTEFKSLLKASYPTGNFQGEIIWFATSSGLPIGGPLIAVNYGKLEKRKLYFISLILYFKTQSAE